MHFDESSGLKPGLRSNSPSRLPGGLFRLVHGPENPLDSLQLGYHKSLFAPISKKRFLPILKKVAHHVFPWMHVHRRWLVEVDDFLFAVLADSQGHEDGAFLSPQAGLAFEHQAVEDEDLVMAGSLRWW